MNELNGNLFAVWGDTPEMRIKKMYTLGTIEKPGGGKVPYGYIENASGIQYVGELYSVIERDKQWNLI